MAFIADDTENDLLQFAHMLLAVRDGYVGTTEVANLVVFTGKPPYVVADIMDRAQQVVNNARVASDRNVSNDPEVQLVEMNVKMPVALVQRGMMLDLEDDPLVNGCPIDGCDCGGIWEYEYGRVSEIEWESPGCIRLDFDNGESLGFPPEHMVTVNGKA